MKISDTHSENYYIPGYWKLISYNYIDKLPDLLSGVSRIVSGQHSSEPAVHDVQFILV